MGWNELLLYPKWSKLFLTKSFPPLGKCYKVFLLSFQKVRLSRMRSQITIISKSFCPQDHSLWMGWFKSLSTPWVFRWNRDPIHIKEFILVWHCLCLVPRFRYSSQVRLTVHVVTSQYEIQIESKLVYDHKKHTCMY